MTRTCPGRSGLRFTSAILRFVLWKTCFEPPPPEEMREVGVRCWGFCLRGQGLPQGGGGGGGHANLGSHCERAEMDGRHDRF